VNQTQIKYARERAASILKQKIVEARDKFTTPAKTLNTEEKLEALKAGKFTINAPVTGRSMWWYNAVDFGETFATTDTDKLKVETDKLNSTFERLMDELILGDKEQVLKMLKEFENI